MSIQPLITQGIQYTQASKYAVLFSSYPLLLTYLYQANVSSTNIAYVLTFYVILMSVLSTTNMEDWFGIINNFIPNDDPHNYISLFRTLTYSIIFIFIAYFFVGYYNIYSDAYHISGGNTITTNITLQPSELEKIGITNDSCDWSFRSSIKLKSETSTTQNIITSNNLSIKKKPDKNILNVIINGKSSEFIVPELSELFYLAVVYHNQSNIINIYINGKVVFSEKLSAPHTWGKLENIINENGAFNMYEAVIEARTLTIRQINRYKKINDRDPINAMINYVLDLINREDPPGKCKSIGLLLQN